MLTDLKSLVKFMIKLTTTKEKWLMIGAKAIRKAFKEDKLSNNGCIRGLENIANVFAKTTLWNALGELLDSTRLSVEANNG